MAAKKGIALKFLQWFIRGVQFCCCAVVLALFSYFLAHLHRNNMYISDHLKAVEGISGVGVIYTLLGLVLLCRLAGIAVTSFIAIVLDVAFAGAFIYVASRNGGGASNTCNSNYVSTQIGVGNPQTDNLLLQACRMEKACLAVSIIAIFFFLFSAIVEVFLARNHRREKRFGPSPHNNYTSGSGSKHGAGPGARRTGFLGRLMSKRSRKTTGMTGDELPQHTHPNAVRDSYATDATAVGSHHAPAREYGNGVGGTNAYKPDQPGFAGDGVAGTNGVDSAHYPSGNYQYGDGTYQAGNAARV